MAYWNERVRETWQELAANLLKARATYPRTTVYRAWVGATQLGSFRVQLVDP